MRLLFADRLPEQTLVELEARGHDCVMEPGLGADDLPAAIAGFQALVVRSTKVGRAVFDAADRLALVIRAGAGTNTIDTEAASSRGVLVCNVPGRNAAAVAELTMGLLLALDRRIADNVADLRNGHWDKQRYSRAGGLLGSTMAVLGLGSVGLAVAERATAFGIEVRALAKPGRAADVVTRTGELGITMCDSMPELVSCADIVSLHVPACDDTRHLVDADFLARMRPGAILLNTSRGDVVDETALLAALDAGRVRAGLDVFADEPGSGSTAWDSPLGRHPDVVATHHIGASTEQAQRAIAAGVIEILDAFGAGEPRNCVNLDRGRRGSSTLTVRHLDRVGVLAQVLGQLSTAGLNVEHMENRIFRSGQAAVASIDVSGRATDELLAALRRTPHVLGVSQATLGEGAGRSVSDVSPFRARVVIQDRAPGSVTAMTSLPDENGPVPPPVVIDPAAYEESDAALYVYRQQDDAGAHTGLVCDVSVQAFADGRIRRHEAVHRGRVAAAVRRRATITGPPALVTLLHRAGPEFTRTLDETRRTPPILDFAGPGGLQQTVWRVAEGPATDAVTEELAAAVHYIADGHHRVEAALEEWRLGGRAADTALLCVVHPMDGLRLSAIHRRVAGPVDPDHLLGLLSPTFEVREVPRPPVPRPGSFGLYVAHRWHDLAYRGPREDAPSGLDVTLLRILVLDRLAGPSGTRPTVESAPVRTSVAELAAQCDGDEGALFTIAPPPLDVLTGLADAGELMPPKSTYFEPKPVAGIFLRP
ncbi:MAG: DUF1015 family protein [Marmoricola sp.]